MSRFDTRAAGALSMFVLVLVIAAGCTSGPGQASTKSPVKVVLTADFSQAVAGNNIPMRDAFVPFINGVNEAGGIDGHMIDVTIKDTQYNAAITTQVLERAIEVDGVMAMVGAASSVEGMAAKKVSGQRQVPLIVGIASGEEITNPLDPWVFRAFPPLNTMMDLDVDILLKSGNRIAMAALEGPYGEGGKALVTASLQKKGLQLLATEFVPANTTDMTPIVLRLKAANPTAILSHLSSGTHGLLMKSLAQAGWKVPVVTGYGSVSAAASMVGKVDAELYSVGILDPASQSAKDLMAAWEKRYGKPLPISEDYAAVGDDLARLLVQGIRTAKLSFDPAKIKDDRSKLRDAIEAISDYSPTGARSGYKAAFSAKNHDLYTKPEALVVKKTTNYVDWQMVNVP